MTKSEFRRMRRERKEGSCELRGQDLQVQRHLVERRPSGLWFWFWSQSCLLCSHKQLGRNRDMCWMSAAPGDKAWTWTVWLTCWLWVLARILSCMKLIMQRSFWSLLDLTAHLKGPKPEEALLTVLYLHTLSCLLHPGVIFCWLLPPYYSFVSKEHDRCVTQK